MALRIFIDNGLEYEYAFLLAVVAFLFVFSYSIVSIAIRYRKGKLSKNLVPSSPEAPDISTEDEYIEAQVADNRLKKIAKAVLSKIRVVRHFMLLANTLLIILAFVLVFDLLQNPGIRVTYPQEAQALKSYEEPLIITFDRPIDTKQFQPYIFPEIQGEWIAQQEFSWLPFKRTVAFYPQESIFPGKVFVYYADITDIHNIQEKWEWAINSRSVDTPEIESVSPENEATDVAVDRELQFKLTSQGGSFVEWRAEVEPEAEHETYFPADDVVQVRFLKNLRQNTSYSIKLYRTPVRYNLTSKEVVERGEEILVSETSFVTVKEPLLESISPNGNNVYVTDSIKVVFDQVMDQDTAQASFSVSPAIQGDFTWENERTMLFKPAQNLAKQTEYTVKLAPGIKSSKGGITESEITHQFKTIGEVTASIGPSGSSVKIGVNISINFNQPVDKNVAQSKFSINPSVAGTFSWNGNTMIFNPNANLAYSTKYDISIGSGVKSIHGIDSKRSYNHSFTTEQLVFTLNVPVYYQTQRFACNLVAARMALAYRGVSVSTSAAHSQIAKDNTPWDPDANTWGNPHVGYVGDINGVSEGYGVYWGPLSSWMSGYRSNSVRVGMSRTAMLTEVQNGNPVIIWAHNGYSGSGANRSWTTPGGTSIYAIRGMHSYVVVGWRGPIDNPSHIILNDPNRGRWTITTGYFDSLWSYFGRAAVVVY